MFQLNSISKAALQIGRSQPAVSQALVSLENTFGASLFFRSTTGIVATKPAHVIYQRVNRALIKIDQFFGELANSSASVPKNVSLHITMTHLSTIKAISEAGGMSAGAVHANKSNASVQKAARSLEETIGVKLFERTSFGVKLTSVALQIAQISALLERELELALSEIAALNNRERGNTIVGALPMARSYIVPKAITLFKGVHPDHDISIVEGPYEFLAHGLLSGKIDMLIGASRVNSEELGIAEEPLISEDVVLILSPAHPLMAVKTITLNHLSDFPWVIPRKSSPLRKTLEDLFAKLPSRPTNIVECNCLSSSRTMLENSPSLMLLSAAQAYYELKTKALISRTIEGFDAQRTISIQTRQDSQLTATQRQLVMYLKRVAYIQAHENLESVYQTGISQAV
ncbi:MAG: LysR family transcriptional regulator [Cellvibrionaceae bacterium]|nr:LysR family transcriptional regulator [Cellvibrionaceae bacterium]